MNGTTKDVFSENEALHARWWLSAAGREAHFRAISDGIPEALYLATPSGEIEIVNRTFLDYFGTSNDTLDTRHFIGKIHPDDDPRFLAVWKESNATGQPFNLEVRRRRADGQYRWFELRGSPLRDQNERIVYWFILERDFEDRKRLEALSAGEKRVLERVAQGEPLPVVLDAVCNLVEGIAEPCWCSILLIDPSGAAFLYGAAPTLPRDYSEVETQVGKLTDFKSGPCGLAASTKQAVIVPDLAAETRWDENGWRTLALQHGLRSVWTSPILSRTEKVIGTFAIYHRASGSPSQFQRDLIGRLTHIASIAIERAKSEEALGKVRADLMHMTRVMSLGALTASIAHEVNQPLSGIVTNASTCLRMLAAEPPNIEGASETARRMIRDGHRAADVIQRLRGLFSKKGPVSEPLDLNDATREVITLLTPDLQRNRVLLRLELGENLPLIFGDRVQLQQVVLNLIRNASDAMSRIEDRARTLTVTTQRRDDQLRLAVKDVGSGIETQNADRLFDAFFTTKNEGMGIGLSVSRSIIESHEGQIWATQNEGPGATFSFSIPLTPKSNGATP